MESKIGILSSFLTVFSSRIKILELVILKFTVYSFEYGVAVKRPKCRCLEKYNIYKIPRLAAYPSEFL
jgi:hypothetical protein